MSLQRAKGLSRSQEPSRQTDTKQSAKLVGGFRWKTWRLEILEAQDDESRRGLWAVFLEKQFSGDFIGTPHTTCMRKGYRGKTSLRPKYYGPTKEPHIL